jgi:molecular chaperone GrpE
MKKNRHNPDAEPADQDAAAPGSGSPAPGGGAGGGSSASSDASQAPPDVDWKERFLRAKADFANLQRRTGDELQAAVRLANRDFARAMLEVADDFQRTLQAAPDSSRDELLAGIRLIHDKLMKVLREQHVEPIAALGQPFDPQMHEALMQQASADHAPGTVIKEIQPGYRLHERILRPARVIISKAPEVAEDQADAPQE